MSEGYLYTCWGSSHLNEALKSLESLRKVDSDAHVTLITTGQRDFPFCKFDRVITSPHLPAVKLGGKVERMFCFYDKTIYLDTDTHICESPRPLFDLLDDYDLAIAPDPGEIDMNGLVAPNTGVMAFRANKKVENLLELYKEYYFNLELWKDHPGRRQATDQPAFARALRDSGVKSYFLPTNYNARYRFWTHLNPGPVKIIHGLDCDFTEIQSAMNENLGNRCWNPKTKRLVNGNA